MALSNVTSLIRTNYPQLWNIGRNCGLCKIQSLPNFAMYQIAFITSKAMRTDRPPRPAPFDWRNNSYKMWHVFTDPMEERLDDNSKIVVVDGLPAIGKDEFAEKLADELEMFYMPPPQFDDIYINSYGFDYRSVNDQLPIDAQFYDEKSFLADPYSNNTAAMQHLMYLLRFNQYIDAITHVFATGQGIVLQRSPWSDFVFMNAMRKAGYVSKGGYDYYQSAIESSLHRLLRPHLVIYLDVPASEVKKRIEKRGLPHEINSKVLTEKYLNDIENAYKKIYLPDISQHAHLLLYNWTEQSDFPTIIDDIEQLNFDDHDRESAKMSDWNFPTWDLRRISRSIFANEKIKLLSAAVVTRLDVPEMLRSAEDHSQQLKVMDKLKEEGPGHKYAAGFDPMLDEGVLWKRKERVYWPVSQKKKRNLEKLNK